MDCSTSSNNSGEVPTSDLKKGEITFKETSRKMANSKKGFLSQFLVEKDMGFTCRFIKTPQSNTIYRIYRHTIENTITFHFSYPSRIHQSPEWWISYPRTCSGALKIGFVPSAESQIRGSRLWIPCKSIDTPCYTYGKSRSYQENSAKEMLSFLGYILEPLDHESSSLEVLKTLVDKFYYSSKVSDTLAISKPATKPFFLDSHPKVDPNYYTKHQQLIKNSLESKFQEKLQTQCEIIGKKYDRLVELVNTSVNQAWGEWDMICQLRESTFKAKMASILKVTLELEQFQKQLKDMAAKVESTIEATNKRKTQQETLKSRMMTATGEIVKDLHIYNTSMRLQLKDIQDKAKKSKPVMMEEQGEMPIENEKSLYNPFPVNFEEQFQNEQINDSAEWGSEIGDEVSGESDSRSKEEEDAEENDRSIESFCISESEPATSESETDSESSDTSAEGDEELLDLEEEETEEFKSKKDDNDDDDLYSILSDSSMGSFVILKSNDSDSSS